MLDPSVRTSSLTTLRICLSLPFVARQVDAVVQSILAGVEAGLYDLCRKFDPHR